MKKLQNSDGGIRIIKGYEKMGRPRINSEMTRINLMRN